MGRQKLAGVTLLVLIGAVASGLATAQHEKGMKDLNLYVPDEIKWVDGPPSLPPGAKAAVLEGDPTKEGPFVLRLKFPDGYKIPPHTHPKPERVTVMSGTLHIAMGDKAEKGAKFTTMPAGSFGTWPAGMKHYARVTGETILQLHGVGPWGMEYVNPGDDPRNAKK